MWVGILFLFQPTSISKLINALYQTSFANEGNGVAGTWEGVGQRMQEETVHSTEKDRVISRNTWISFKSTFLGKYESEMVLTQNYSV